MFQPVIKEIIIELAIKYKYPVETIEKVDMPIIFAVVYREAEEQNPGERTEKNKYDLSQRMIRGYKEARAYIEQNRQTIRDAVKRMRVPDPDLTFKLK